MHSSFGLDHRHPNHLIDALCARHQHDQAVKAKSNPAGRRHVRKRGEKVFIDRISFRIDAVLFRHCVGKPGPLLRGIGQFGKGIGEFDAAGVELEALSDLVASQFRTRQCGERQRILGQYCRPPDTKMWVDPLNKNAAENITPCIVVGDRDAGRFRFRGQRIAVPSPLHHRAQEIDPRIAHERGGNRKAFRRSERVRGSPAMLQQASTACARRFLEKRGTVFHQLLIGRFGPIPFEHGEFRMMEDASLTISKHPSEFHDSGLAGRHQFFACKFGRSTQKKRAARLVRPDQAGLERVQVRFISGRHLKGGRLHFDEPAGGKPGAQGTDNSGTRRQVWPTGRVRLGTPEWRTCGHIYLDWTTGGKHWHRPRRSLWCAPKPGFRKALNPRIDFVKVIASQLRKGNIVDIDGKLYVVLTAENFHPGKGTPTTQVDMRRISDGVKTSQRYKTTDQVERAHVEDHEFSFLYQDGDGFHFMNQETFDQIQVPSDVIGDQSIYLQEGMVVNLSVHENVPVAIELPQKVTLEIVDTEPVVKGQTASGSFKPAKLSNGARTMVPTHITVGTRVVVSTADGSYVERAKD